MFARDRKPPPTGREKVLVVDDDSTDRELLRQFLEAKGYEVALAASGEQALELVDATGLDLVLLDLSLPRANSLDVLKHLRGDHSAADLPVIMVSGENDGGRVVEALTLGANDYISKPIELGMAIGRIRTQLARRKLENKLRTDAAPFGAEAPSSEAQLARGGVGAGLEDSQRQAGSPTAITSRKPTDSVTGLPVESQFVEWISESLKALREGAGGRFGIAAFRVDRLHAVHDGLGEAAAADLARHFAGGLERYLEECVSEKCDLPPQESQARIGRLSDGEFGVLIGGSHSEAQMAGYVRHLQQKLNGSVTLGGSRVYASLSAGLIPDASGYATPAELLRDARTAVEQADSLGGGHALTFKPQMRNFALGRMELEYDLRNAVTNKEFELHYQPKVLLESGALLGFEALLRWRHPRRMMVPPLEFIPLAEETGLIVAIGDWVLEEACRQTCDWQVRYAAHSQLTVGVNVSSKQLEDPGLTTRILKILAETGLPPECLELEITESALVSDGPEVLKLLKELRSRNIGLHIDDFGTGYSALQYLQRLPFDTLKIDKSFVERLGATRENTEVTRAIIALAHHLNMNVVSEGIETREQLNILRDFGARVGQGYLFSRPLSLEQAEELLMHGFEYDMEALLTPD